MANVDEMPSAPVNDHAANSEVYECTVNLAPDGIYRLDKDGRFVLVSDVIVEQSGYEREEILGSHVSVMVGSADIARVEDEIRRLLQSEHDRMVVEVDIQTATGELVRVEVGIRALTDDSGFCGTVGVVHEKTRPSSPLWRTTVDRSGMFAWYVPTNSVVCDHRAAKLLGLPTEPNQPIVEVPIETFTASIHRDDRERLLAEIEQAVTRNEEFHARCRVGRDHPRWMWLRGLAEYDESSDPVAIHGEFVESIRQVPDHVLAAELAGTICEIVPRALRANSRDQIEKAVCNRLVQTRSFEIAWFGRAASRQEQLSPHTIVGTDRVPEESSQFRLADRAWQTGKLQIEQGTQATGGSSADERSSAIAAIPIITPDEVPYGVLTVATSDCHTFDDTTEQLLEVLGETVSQTLVLIDQLAMRDRDQAIEFEIRVPDFFAPLKLSGEELGRLSIERVIAASEEEYLAYGHVPKDGALEWQRVAAQIPWVEQVEIKTDRPWSQNEAHCEFRLSNPPAISTIRARGGEVVEASIEAGTLRLIARVPGPADMKQVAKTIRETFDGGEIVAKRNISAVDADRSRPVDQVVDTLTERQFAVLRTAYEKGYFQWPRSATGGEVAETLGISSSTFSEHIRAAQQKLFREIFDNHRR